MLYSSGEGSGMGCIPYVVVEPYGLVPPPLEPYHISMIFCFITGKHNLNKNTNWHTHTETHEIKL